jgi:hypothetical protein
MYRTELLYIPANPLTATHALHSSRSCLYKLPKLNTMVTICHPQTYMQVGNMTLHSWFERTRILFSTVQELSLLFRIASDNRGQDAPKKIIKLFIYF